MKGNSWKRLRVSMDRAHGTIWEVNVLGKGKEVRDWAKEEQKAEP